MLRPGSRSTFSLCPQTAARRWQWSMRRGTRLIPFERIRVSDGRTEAVAGLTGVRQTGFRNAVRTGLTPDNDPLILRDVGTEELYSLDTIVH